MGLLIILPRKSRRGLQDPKSGWQWDRFNVRGLTVSYEEQDKKVFSIMKRSSAKP